MKHVIERLRLSGKVGDVAIARLIEMESDLKILLHRLGGKQVLTAEDDENVDQAEYIRTVDETTGDVTISLIEPNDRKPNH